MNTLNVQTVKKELPVFLTILDNHIELNWELLRPGGVMLEDDYCTQTWPDVVKAVHEFFPTDQIHIEDGGKWWVQKPLHEFQQPQQQTFFKSW